MALSARCKLNIRITLAVIGVSIGSMIFVSFGLMFENWDAAVWGLASAVFAFITLCTHLVYRHDECRAHSFLLPVLIVIGALGQLGAIAAFIAYIVLAIIQHQQVTGHGKGYYVAAVWCAMTWKWAFFLLLYSIRYKRSAYSLSVQADPIRQSSGPYRRIDDTE